MKISQPPSQGRSEDGYVLAVVLIFLVVLSVTAFFAAAMTRTDIQVVNNLQNEKEAQAIAEAGINEALYRLNLNGSGAITTTINGVNGGSAFNPSIAPSVPGRIVSCAGTPPACGASPFGIDSTNINSTTQVLFTTAAPATGTNSTTPTLQPIASRLPYSTGTADTGTIDFTTTENVTVGWDVCGAANTALGCSAPNTIRQLPRSDPRPVVKIVSIGQSGTARRRVTVWAADTGPTAGNPSILLLGDACNQGMSLNGTTGITVAGMVNVNAGAADTSSPPCTTVSTVGDSSIHSAGTSVSGSASGNFSPAAQSGVIPSTDPYASMLPPCFGSITTGCQTISPAPTVQNHSTNPSLPLACDGTDTSPNHCSVSGGTLNPGIYYGGISISGATVLNPGVYIMAGSGGSGVNRVSFEGNNSNGGSTTTASGGLMVYNTQNDNPGHRTGDGQFGSFDLGTGNATLDLAAPSSGPYASVLLFQDRSNTKSVDLTAGSSGSYTWSGLIYAPSAGGSLGGYTIETITGSVVLAGPLNVIGGSTIYMGDPSGGGNPGGNVYTPLAWQDF
jgi:Tfp pilus assembly protein PilX